MKWLKNHYHGMIRSFFVSLMSFFFLVLTIKAAAAFGVLDDGSSSTSVILTTIFVVLSYFIGERVIMFTSNGLGGMFDDWKKETDEFKN